MIRLTPAGLAVLGVVVMAALGFGLKAFADLHHDRGYAEGYATRDAEAEAALAEAQAKIDRLAAMAQDRARDLAEAEAHTATLLEELADEAARDPDGIRLSADSVRRLNAVAGLGSPDDPAAP
jgi:uncharacterized protein YlxW (UPF0749 family)